MHHRANYCNSRVKTLQLLCHVCWTSFNLLWSHANLRWWCVMCVCAGRSTSESMSSSSSSESSSLSSECRSCITDCSGPRTACGTKHKNKNILELFFSSNYINSNAKEKQASSSGSCCVVERWWDGVVDPEFAGSWRLESTADMTPGRLEL